MHSLYGVTHPVWGKGYLQLREYTYERGCVFLFTSIPYGTVEVSSRDMVNHNIPPFSVTVGRIKR